MINHDKSHICFSWFFPRVISQLFGLQPHPGPTFAACRGNGHSPWFPTASARTRPWRHPVAEHGAGSDGNIVCDADNGCVFNIMIIEFKMNVDMFWIVQYSLFIIIITHNKCQHILASEHEIPCTLRLSFHLYQGLALFVSRALDMEDLLHLRSWRWNLDILDAFILWLICG